MEGQVQIRSIKDLKVYNRAYELAVQVFEITKVFPREEKYSLTDQIRRSSRSVAMNIREGFAKRKYKQIFIKHLTDSLGSSDETRGWLDFSHDFGYLPQNKYVELENKYDQLNAMLYALIKNWQDW